MDRIIEENKNYTTLANNRAISLFRNYAFYKVVCTFHSNYTTRSTSVILQCFVMSCLWLLVLLANFSRFISNAAVRSNAVLNATTDNLEGSIDINGLPSSTVPLLSKLHQEPSTPDSRDGKSQSVEPSGIQPRLLDTEELRAGLLRENQNELVRRELNNSLAWWRIKGQQQYKVKLVHRRWRQQSPLLNQQYYKWRRQRLAVVENQQIQKLGNSLTEKSQNRGTHQTTTWNTNYKKQNKVLLSNVRNYPENPRAFDLRQQKLENGKHKELNSKLQRPDSLLLSSKIQTEQQQSDATPSSTEADEESASNSENSWTNEKLYPIWKPQLPGLGIFPLRAHAVAGGNALIKRHSNIKPVQSGAQSMQDSNVKETWIFGLSLSYKKIEFPEQLESVSQPTYHQTNSISQEVLKQPIKLSETNRKPLQSGSPGLPVIPSSLVPNSTETRNIQESAQVQKMQVPLLSSTVPQTQDVDSTSELMTVEPEFYTTKISAKENEVSIYNSSSGSQLNRKPRLFGSDGVNFAHRLKKRTIDSHASSPKETDNRRLSNMESLGGPMNVDPYDVALQGTNPSKSSVDMELSSNEMEYLFQAISSGMKLLKNKIMGN